MYIYLTQSVNLPLNAEMLFCRQTFVYVFINLFMCLSSEC